MRGSIYQKPSNKKYYPYIYDKETKSKKWGRGYIKKGDAETELRKLLNEYDNGSVVFGKSETFKSVYEQWVELIAPEMYTSTNSLSTNKGYIKNHVLPSFEKIRIDRITTQDCQRLFFAMHALEKKPKKGEVDVKKKKEKKPLSPATKRKILGLLNSIFDNAADWGMVGENPCTGIKLKSPTQKEMVVWNNEQLNYFLDFINGTKYYVPFLILATTGMRRGEVCALQWKDFDGESLVLSKSMDINGELTDMKTSSSHRKINLMVTVVEVLNSHKIRQANICKTLGNKSLIDGNVKPWDYICTGDFNERILPESLTMNFRRAVKRNNKENEYQLPEVRLHDLRHGFATFALSSGENIKVISEILGHAKTSTTQNIYQHSTETMQKASVSRIENIMFKPKEVSTEISTETVKNEPLGITSKNRKKA